MGRVKDARFWADDKPRISAAGQEKTICDGHDLDEDGKGVDEDEKDGNDGVDDKNEKREEMR